MNLISLPVEVDKKKIDGRYRLVLAVAKRARELYQGAQPKVTSKAKKIAIIALEEVISNSVCVLTGEAAVKAKEKAKRLTYEDMIDEAKQKKNFSDDLTELEKDLKVYLYEKGVKDNKETIEEIFPEKGSK
jgi:DNA-directed RNA polymerase subunit omega